MSDEPEYQRLVEELAKLCRCTPIGERPCDGLLAGGVCDDLHWDNNEFAEGWVNRINADGEQEE